MGVGERMWRWKLEKPGHRECEQAVLLTHRQESDKGKGWGDLAGKGTQFSQLRVEPYADDDLIPRAQARACVSQGLPARPGEGGRMRPGWEAQGPWRV